VDVRLLAATNRVPAEAVGEGLLREDLYFRLQVFPIYLPPLRARTGDTRLLAEFFLQRLNREMNASLQFSDTAHSRLASYKWPGNVRELENSVHRAAVLARKKDGEINMPDDIGEDMRAVSLKGLSPGRSIRDVERDLITLTLKHYGRDKKAAAASLGISLKTLYNRINAYDKANNAEM
jgi:transcriptional regulator with PAS, ATPase and Fis domain